MQSERDTRDGVSRSHGLFDSFQGFGSRRSMFPSLFGGRDPFGDPFFSRPIGSIFESSMFSPSSVSSDTPGSGRANKISVSGKEPSIDHPDDVVDAERKSKDVTYRNDRNNVEGAQSQGHNFSVQTCRVTCGDVDGAYYTSTRTRRAGGDGVALEETKEADKTTGQATHRVSRGLHDKVPVAENRWEKRFWQGLLPPSEQTQSTRGMGSDNAAQITSDGWTKRVVRINID
ncbi:hypothetical protein ACFX2A_041596 [Malus domestica]